MFLGANLTKTRVHDNQANHNGRRGIAAAAGSTGNVIEHNSMHGNGTNPNLEPRGVDARDENKPLNEWIDNDCVTDFPIGAICGAP